MGVTSAETIRWRNLPDIAAKYAAKGVEQLGCANMATYRIGEDWLCTKHAGMVALAILTVEVPPGEG
jgi:hypothetical protein